MRDFVVDHPRVAIVIAVIIVACLAYFSWRLLTPVNSIRDASAAVKAGDFVGFSKAVDVRGMSWHLSGEAMGQRYGEEAASRLSNDAAEEIVAHAIEDSIVSGKYPRLRQFLARVFDPRKIRGISPQADNWAKIDVGGATVWWDPLSHSVYKVDSIEDKSLLQLLDDVPLPADPSELGPSSRSGPDSADPGADNSSPIDEPVVPIDPSDSGSRGTELGSRVEAALRSDSRIGGAVHDVREVSAWSVAVTLNITIADTGNKVQAEDAAQSLAEFIHSNVPEATSVHVYDANHELIDVFSSQ